MSWYKYNNMISNKKFDYFYGVFHKNIEYLETVAKFAAGLEENANSNFFFQNLLLPYFLKFSPI